MSTKTKRRKKHIEKTRRKSHREKDRIAKDVIIFDPNESPVGLPDFHAVERAMRGMGNLWGSVNQDDAIIQAQELAFDAMGADDFETAADLAMQAVSLDPGCVDAQIILAQVGSLDANELIDNLRIVVEIGEATLGKDFIEENRGCFWDILETRPYMRARVLLAEVLAGNDRIPEAIEEYEQLLRLNPNDNQGNRYLLLGCYLRCEKLEGARRIFHKYKEENSAIFTWSRVLERVLSEDDKAAQKALKDARKSNPHVEAYLAGKKRLPKQLPEFYGFGDLNEAKFCADTIGMAWKQHPLAVKWLKNAATS